MSLHSKRMSEEAVVWSGGVISARTLMAEVHWVLRHYERVVLAEASDWGYLVQDSHEH